MYEGVVQDLIDELGRLPGVGPKSAQRMAYHVLERDRERAAELARLLAQLGELERSNQLLLESLGLLHQGLPPLPQPQGVTA